MNLAERLTFPSGEPLTQEKEPLLSPVFVGRRGYYGFAKEFRADM